MLKTSIGTMFFFENEHYIHNLNKTSNLFLVESIEPCKRSLCMATHQPSFISMAKGH